MSKEEESRGGRSSGRHTPPRYPNHCDKHANVAIPGRCGDCKDRRLANEQQPSTAVLTLVTGEPRKPWCGRCSDDVMRQLETPVGVIRCPECHPLAEEAS